MNVLAPHRRFAEARELLARAEELDPASPAVGASRGILALYAGDAAGAVESLEAVVRTVPRFGLACFFLGQAYDALGDPEKAVEAARLGVEHSHASSETLAAYASALARAGRAAQAAETAARLEARARRRYVSPVLLAQVAPDPDRALDLLDAAAATRAVDLIWIGVRPTWAGLRAHPRFVSILERVGLPGD
jgi:tetratricopeptide (TPR) repeat protein